MSRYTQLTRDERYQIYALLKAGHNQMCIAELIGRHKATISREVRRNRGLRGYRPKQAQTWVISRRSGKAFRRISATRWGDIEDLLHGQWSPEQISGYARTQLGWRVSHEWIYKHVLADKRSGGTLHHHLRCQKRRRKRYGSYERRGQLHNRVPIAQRPTVVDQRCRLGDREADTVIGTGHSGVLVTLTERVSGLSLFARCDSKHAEPVAATIADLLGPLKDDVCTITADNGKEWRCLSGAILADSWLGHQKMRQ